MLDDTQRDIKSLQEEVKRNEASIASRADFEEEFAEPDFRHPSELDPRCVLDGHNGWHAAPEALFKVAI
jgi:hypothetical protein